MARKSRNKETMYQRVYLIIKSFNHLNIFLQIIIICNNYRIPIKCGDIIRLEHIATKKNLHSHRVSSPLSGKQEISAYGDNKGEGDNGDNWLLICQTEFWRRDESIMLKHVDTDT